MSKISIKTDFDDGEKLFAQELNNNFSVIEAGVNANEENLQEVIDQAIVELDNELEEITADRGWDWNGGDRVTFYKGDTTAINSREIVDGQLLYNTATGETALDDNGSRITTGSGNVVVVSDTAPTNLATKEWIKPTTISGTPTAEEYFRDVQNNWVKVITTPSGDTLPIGAIAQFGGSVAPTNWLFCNGQAVSRETYSELFSAIGTTYGDGDGSTTFNLPDFSSRSPMGVGQGTDDNSLTETTTLGQIKGEYKHTLSTDEMPKHRHTITATTTLLNGTAGGTGIYIGSGSTVSSYEGDDQAHNIIQPVLGVNFIIKAKQSVGIVGTITNDITDTNFNAVPNAVTVKDYVDGLNVYSTTEKIIGTYADNKPLYEKTIIGTFQNNDVLLSNIDSLVEVKGSGKHQESSIWRLLPYYEYYNNQSYTLTVKIASETTNLVVTSESQGAAISASLKITIKYTKTTD